MEKSSDMKITYESFKEEWLHEILDNEPTTVQKGNRFARKLLTQWLDLDNDNNEITFCDGTGDGGIDAVFLKRGEEVVITSTHLFFCSDITSTHL